jgi:3-mercaptopyruvate sulfurtransferase SseA
LKLGIANVRALKGGYHGWVAAGNAVVRGDKPK